MRGDATRTHGERLPLDFDARCSSSRRRRSMTSICSRSPRAPGRSPACASASRRCRAGDRARPARRAGLDARGAGAAAAPPAIGAHRRLDGRAARRSLRGAAPRRAARRRLDAAPRRSRPPRRSTTWPTGAHRAAARVLFVGDGAVRYADAFATLLGPRADIDRPRRRSPAPSAASPARSAERAVRPHAIVPIYVGGRTPSWRAPAARRPVTAGSMRVERLSTPTPTPTSTPIVGARSASFTNPWTRDMLAASSHSDVTRRLRAARRPARRRRVLLLLGDRRRAAHQHAGGRAPAPAAGHRDAAAASHVLAERDRARAAGHARGPALERRGARASTSGSASQRRGVRPGYYTQPEEDALILWWNP